MPEIRVSLYLLQTHLESSSRHDFKLFWRFSVTMRASSHIFRIHNITPMRNSNKRSLFSSVTASAAKQSLNNQLNHLLFYLFDGMRSSFSLKTKIASFHSQWQRKNYFVAGGFISHSGVISSSGAWSSILCCSSRLRFKARRTIR